MSWEIDGLMDGDPKSHRSSHCRETQTTGREWFRCLPETHAAEIKQTSAGHSGFTKCPCVVVYVCVIMLFSLLTTSVWTACGVSDSSPGRSAAIVATHTSVKLTAYTLGPS